MTDEQWLEGIEELLAVFPDRDQDEKVTAKRGEIYRRELDHLTSDAWFFAVREAIRSERWFPTVAVLLEFAVRAPSPAMKAGFLLSDDTRTEEEKRADDARGLAAIRAALAERGVAAPAVQSMPKPSTTVEATPERVDELKRQAQRITSEDAVAVLDMVDLNPTETGTKR